MLSYIKIFFINFWKIALRHKIVSTILAVVVIYGGYYAYGKLTGVSAQTHYVLSVIEKGTLISSVSGSGQVSASELLDLKPKVSGNVIYIAAISGQQLKAGDLILKIDSQDAAKAVRDAEVNLESSQIALEKLIKPADILSTIQAENALTQSKQSQQNAQDDLVKAYDDGFNTVANTFIDLPGVMTGLDNILNGLTVNGSQSNAYAYYDLVKNYKSHVDQFRDAALLGYKTARVAYDKNLQDYKNTSRYTDHATVDSLISETYDTTKSISEAIKNTKSLLDLVNDALTSGALNTRPPAILSTHENSLQNYTGTTNNNLGSLLNIKNTIKNDQDIIVSSDRTIAEKTEALAKLKFGADPLDVKSQSLSIKQKENALLDAQENLSNYYIRSPFDGVVAKINVKKGDPASSGTVLATVITKQQIAEISLNEIDVAKVKVNQKVTLTFDAFPDLTITGKVFQVDTIGTVTQGVVNYSVKIVFDTQDDRIKPAMSVSAAVIIDSKQDVLIASNGAVKSQGGGHYVEMIDSVQGNPTPANLDSQGIISSILPRKQSVEIGIASDSMTEIISGLKEGDIIVTRTVTATSQTTTPTQNSSFRIPGLGGGGGGGGRRDN